MAGKRVRIFAGPNGAGKSTLFQDFSKAYPTSSFINADLIEKILKEKAFINLAEYRLEVHQEDFNAFLNHSSIMN